MALHLARLFREAGFRVLSAESMKYPLLSFSNAVDRCFSLPGPAADEAGFVEGLASLIREQGVDWLIPTCEETFYIAKYRRELESYCRVLDGRSGHPGPAPPQRGFLSRSSSGRGSSFRKPRWFATFRIGGAPWRRSPFPPCLSRLIPGLRRRCTLWRSRRRSRPFPSIGPGCFRSGFRDPSFPPTRWRTGAG